MGKIVYVGSLEFKTKKAAKEFFRGIRDRYQNGQSLSSEDDGYLRDLITIHPEAKTKVGCGISHFTVERDAKFGTTRHFMIHRRDGSGTDFSFHSAIDGRNEWRDRYEALRRAIEEHILDFKTCAFSTAIELVCPLRGIPITEKFCHVDHTPPLTFFCLVNEWLDAEEIDLIDLEITPPADNQIVTELIDPRQAASWREFHRRRAKLRLLSPLGNLSDAKLQAG